MDFMTINLDNTNVKHNPLCSDMRILKTLNDNLYFFAYNSVVLDFLKIWTEYNTSLKYQHKHLEYAFNISLAINKMRCSWFPREYVLGPVLKYGPIGSFFNNKYPSDNKKIKSLTRSLQQCGIKPALPDGEPLPTHHRGSVHGSIYHNRYGKLFLEL